MFNADFRHNNTDLVDSHRTPTFSRDVQVDGGEIVRQNNATLKALKEESTILCESSDDTDELLPQNTSGLDKFSKRRLEHIIQKLEKDRKILLKE